MDLLVELWLNLLWVVIISFLYHSCLLAKIPIARDNNIIATLSEKYPSMASLPRYLVLAWILKIQLSKL